MILYPIMAAMSASLSLLLVLVCGIASSVAGAGQVSCQNLPIRESADERHEPFPCRSAETSFGLMYVLLPRGSFLLL